MSKPKKTAGISVPIKEDDDYFAFREFNGLLVFDVHSEFFGPHNGLLKEFKKLFFELSQDRAVHFATVTAETVSAFSKFANRARSVIVLMKDGRVVSQIMGGQWPEIRRQIVEHAPSLGDYDEPKTQFPPEMQTELQRPLTPPEPHEYGAPRTLSRENSFASFSAAQESGSPAPASRQASMDQSVEHGASPAEKDHIKPGPGSTDGGEGEQTGPSDRNENENENENENDGDGDDAVRNKTPEPMPVDGGPGGDGQGEQGDAGESQKGD